MARLGAAISVLSAICLIDCICFAAPADWTLKDNYAQKGAKVSEVSVLEGRPDLLKIDTGTQSNLRIGVVCSVSRQSEKVAEAIIVDSDRNSSVAMILTGGEVLTGDAVHITPAN